MTSEHRIPDLRFIHAFTTLYELRSARAAAKALYRTQPAITYQIKAFEREIGALLFDRVGRRLVPNAAGHRVYAQARLLLDGFITMQRDLGQDVEPTTEQLSVASVSGFGRYVLCPLLYAKEFERVSLRIQFATASDVMQRVESGRADIGFVYLRAFSTSLEFSRCFEEELVLITPRGWRFRPTLNDLANRPWVTYVESEYVFARWFDTVFGRQPKTLNSSSYVDELEEAIGLVACGRGLSIVPYDAAIAAPGSRRIRIHRLGRLRCENSVYVVVRAGGLVSKEMQQVLNRLGSLPNENSRAITVSSRR